MAYDENGVYGDVSAVHMLDMVGFDKTASREEPRPTTQPLDYAMPTGQSFSYVGRPGSTVMQLRTLAVAALSKLQRPSKVHDEEYIGDTLMLDRRVG